MPGNRRSLKRIGEGVKAKIWAAQEGNGGGIQEETPVLLFIWGLW